jgi:hypothetical protein
MSILDRLRKLEQEVKKDMAETISYPTLTAVAIICTTCAYLGTLIPYLIFIGPIPEWLLLAVLGMYSALMTGLLNIPSILQKWLLMEKRFREARKAEEDEPAAEPEQPARPNLEGHVDPGDH